MIRSFANKDTEGFAEKGTTRAGWQKAAKVATRKVDLLNAAETLDDLRAPPGNKLEALSGDRMGQHSIRINDQWRICFRWTGEGPTDVEITDYH